MTCLKQSGYVPGLVLMLSAGVAQAFDSGSVSDRPAVLYDTPSYNGIRSEMPRSTGSGRINISHQDGQSWFVRTNNVRGV